jgi:uncharacterized protein YoxC
MTMPESLGLALTIIAIVLALLGIYAVVVLIRLVAEVRTAVSEIRVRIVPLLDKADVTVDAINVELLRLDGIVTQAENVGDAVSTASDFIRSPVNSAARGVVRVLRKFRKG